MLLVLDAVYGGGCEEGREIKLADAICRTTRRLVLICAKTQS